MPNDSYENLPRVNFSVNTKEFELLRAKAQVLARMGMPEAMAEFNREYARAKAASKIFIHNWREYPHFDKWGMNRPPLKHDSAFSFVLWYI
ncbi:hypothetical protein [Limosilactobacillus reuteri]|uniref:hypothetical protein n=1 Tax=Limosilactobacillus reuteri TaxID=1598 RepID=UPI002B05EAFD|nr:hypothetical protein [Limosilactobacillus reuteri]